MQSSVMLDALRPASPVLAIRSWEELRKRHSCLHNLRSLSHIRFVQICSKPIWEVCCDCALLFCHSEGKLNRALQDTRSRCADCLSKSRAADIAVDCLRAVELRMVEDIKCLNAEEQGLRLRERQILRSGHVVVVRSRA